MTTQQVVLGLGSGQCGFHLLVEILRRQPDARITFEQPPVLPWKQTDGWPGIRERIARWKATSKERLVGDVAAFYLPHVIDAIECEPSIRIVCLRRPRQEVIDGFCRELDAKGHAPTDHWSIAPKDGLSHDPIWTPSFPQYDVSSREEAIGLYWDEYELRSTSLAKQFPAQFLIMDPDDLTQDQGVRRLLSFVGIPEEDQVIVTGKRAEPVVTAETRTSAGRGHQDPRRCVVLVPHAGTIHSECEESLKELERRGYPVRRVSGYAAIDQGRNQMVTDALIDGFEETMWIDSDIGFHADDVEKLRAHQLPIVSAMYPQKGKRMLASHLQPGTPQVTFGVAGGLIELLYAATGFLHVRRQVYLDIQRQLSLPICNERFGRPLLPFFLPMLHQIDDGHWYLAEDFAFSQRARQCGYKIYADTRIRLTHIGSYGYTWEDAGAETKRFDTYTLNCNQDVQKPEKS